MGTLDLQDWLSLISTGAIVLALVFAGVQVREANRSRRDQGADRQPQAVRVVRVAGRPHRRAARHPRPRTGAPEAPKLALSTVKASSRMQALALYGIGVLLSSAQCMASEYPPDAGTLALIARDVEDLKGKYPQHEGFSSQENLDAGALTISYAYRTHTAERSGGWTAGVPSPDDDGVWFYIDFHDPASTAQIHTQPLSFARHCLGKKVVSFLILEGPKTASVNGAIWQILKKYGISDCSETPGGAGGTDSILRS